MAPSMEPRHRLRAWIERAKMKQIEFSRLIESDPATVSKILIGERRPSFEVAAKIEAHTGIPATGWLSSQMDKHLAATGTDGRKRK